jgi:DNA-binding GntR family transcriptional regulator
MATPYYQRIVADIRARIASGQWPPGHRLPGNFALRDLYRDQFRSPTLALATVQRALDVLKQTGELRGQQGLGVFVADQVT